MNIAPLMRKLMHLHPTAELTEPRVVESLPCPVGYIYIMGW
jgi:hypothetical protein